MLKRLNVRNYVLIDSLDVSFPEGLVIITGQTGAGKSVMLGALSLLLGAKADAGMIGEASDNCVVEAEFEMSDSGIQLKRILDENDVDWNDGCLVIRRVINPNGRSRSFVNDSPVPLQLLSSISSCLIDIHSQHQTLLLNDHGFQLELLDHFAGNDGLMKRYRESYQRYLALKAELDGITGRISEMKLRQEYNQALLQQLEAASLKENEVEELEAEQKRLANAEEIKEGLYSAMARIEDSSDDSGGMSVSSALKESARLIGKVSRFVPSAGPLSERLGSCRVEIDDILSELSALHSGIDVSPDRLAQVEERLSLLYGLMQKHSCRTVGELMGIRDSLSESLCDLTLLEERKVQTASSLESGYEALKKMSAALHEARADAASAFSASIMKSMRFLELPSAVFTAELLPVDLCQNGEDSVRFMFSSVGKNPVPVEKCASGGELSRIMLALKDMMARYTEMPTMIFDEIDSGVSGSVADKMGSMICGMGDRMQVFAITHLPQVAAKGSAHYLVSKETDPVTSNIVTRVTELSEEQRVLEIARLLSGSVLTEAAVANARSLLSGQA